MMSTLTENYDWKPIMVVGSAGWRQAMTTKLEGSVGLRSEHTAGTANAFIRRSGAWTTKRLNSKHAVWIYLDTSQVTFCGMIMRLQSSVTSPDDLTPSILTTNNCYFANVDRFYNLSIYRGKFNSIGASTLIGGPLSLSAVTIDGGIYPRVDISNNTTTGAVDFTIWQSSISTPSLIDDADWTYKTVYSDTSGSRILTAGYAGLYNVGTTSTTYVVYDRYMDYFVS